MLKLFIAVLDSMNVKYEIDDFNSPYGMLIKPNRTYPKEADKVVTVHNSPNIHSFKMCSSYFFDAKGDLIGVGHYETL